MQSILRVPNLFSFTCTHITRPSESVSSNLIALNVAGGAPGPHLPGAQPPQRDAAHHPARLQDPPHAEEEDAGGRQQRRGLGLGRVLGREQAAGAATRLR